MPERFLHEPNVTAVYAAFDVTKTAGALAQVAASIKAPGGP